MSFSHHSRCRAPVREAGGTVGVGSGFDGRVVLPFGRHQRPKIGRIIKDIYIMNQMPNSPCIEWISSQSASHFGQIEYIISHQAT